MVRYGLPRLPEATWRSMGGGQTAYQPDQPRGDRWRTAEMDRGGQGLAA